MRIFHCKTVFGKVQNISIELADIINTLPIIIYSINGKKVFKSFKDYFKKDFSTPTAKRFMSRAIEVYMEEAIKVMVEDRAQVPIGKMGIFMAIGEDKLASTKKNYKFDFDTQGKVYLPIISMPNKVSVNISFIYRLRFNKPNSEYLSEAIKRGKRYQYYEPVPAQKLVNNIYEKAYLKMLSKKFTPKYGYSIKF